MSLITVLDISLFKANFRKFSLFLYNSDKQKGSRQSCITLKYVTIKHTIITFNQINSLFSAHLKKSLHFHPCTTWENRNENIKGLLAVQRHEYRSDFKLSFYVITYYKVTSPYLWAAVLT